MADPQPPQPVAPKPAAESKFAALEHEIEDWFRAHFHDSIVSRSEEIFAHVHAAKEKLKARLKAML